MLIRNFFAAVEGWTFQCKRTALAVTNFTEVEFERGELALLEEESYDLTDKGTVSVGKSKLNTLYNFIFALKMVVKACDEGDLEIDKSGVGWQSLQDTMRIRDRITHPKYPLDMEITDVEMKAFDKAADWYGHLLIALGELLEKFEQRHLSGFVRIN